MSVQLPGIEQNDNRRQGMVGSLVLHAILLLLFIIPFITFPIPPPGQQGIVVSLGLPDIGDGDDKPETQNKEVVEPTPPASTPTPVKEPEPEVKQVVAREVEQQKEVVTSDEAEVRINKAEEEEAKRKREAELQKQRELDEAKRQAEMEAQRKAEEEAKKQAEYQESKKQFGQLLAGSGKGETGTPGNQGVADGDPDASALEGISTGSGVIGGGLSNRGVLYEPRINDSSQETGVVVVKVCVDNNGDVVSAEYTQRGSTTTNSTLKQLAIKNARKFKFNSADVDKQCGTITIDFRVR